MLHVKDKAKAVNEHVLSKPTSKSLHKKILSHLYNENNGKLPFKTTSDNDKYFSERDKDCNYQTALSLLFFTNGMVVLDPTYASRKHSSLSLNKKTDIQNFRWIIWSSCTKARISDGA